MIVTPTSHAYNVLIQGQYTDAVMAYKQAIASNPDDPNLYWNYGIALLLNGQEEEAQSVWMTVLLEAISEDEQTHLRIQLVQALDAAAQRCEARIDKKAVWILRYYQCEFDPDNPVSVRDLVMAGLWAEVLTLNDAELEYFVAIAKQSETLFSPLHIERTGECLYLLLTIDPAHPATQTFTDLCIQRVEHTPQIDAIVESLRQSARMLRRQSRYIVAETLIRKAIQLAPNDISVVKEAIEILSWDIDARRRGIQLAEQIVSIAKTPTERLNALEVLLITSLGIGGQDQKVQEIYPQYTAQLQALANEVKSLADIDVLSHPEQIQAAVERLGNLDVLVTAGFLCLYLEDNPHHFRAVRNPLAMAAQAHMQIQNLSHVKRFQSAHSAPTRCAQARPLRIGYLADTFRQHSVGWLCRWLLNYHDRDRFDVHLYTPVSRPNDVVQHALIHEYGDRFHIVPEDGVATANRIFDDEIDVLIELDSVSSSTSLLDMALKPAPVQVSWLGFDTSGLPAIDYFIADPYVLPDSAEQDYSETIWRLPTTYLAVDGFEAYTTTLTRRDLDIPPDAVVYLSAQSGFKRNPHNVKQQLQILNDVPNSYFLIKGTLSDPDIIQPFFYDLADEVGVASDRLRFLPDFPSEFIYRATLQLADVVLDTYPYNGATTTMEALWMGLPIVTRVGEQFAARNSYTMMVNAGITEGIAWSDEEYVEWGIRLGEDESLRRDITWKLKRSRHTAPLWDAKRFAKEMEHAYEQMWQRWCDRRSF